MTTDISAAMDSCVVTHGAAFSALDSVDQTRALETAIGLSFSQAATVYSPVAEATDFWAFFMKIFEMLLPLIIKLISGI